METSKFVGALIIFGSNQFITRKNLPLLQVGCRANNLYCQWRTGGGSKNRNDRRSGSCSNYFLSSIDGVIDFEFHISHISIYLVIPGAMLRRMHMIPKKRLLHPAVIL